MSLRLIHLVTNAGYFGTMNQMPRNPTDHSVPWYVDLSIMRTISGRVGYNSWKLVVSQGALGMGNQFGPTPKILRLCANAAITPSCFLDRSMLDGNPVLGWHTTAFAPVWPAMVPRLTLRVTLA